MGATMQKIFFAVTLMVAVSGCASHVDLNTVLKSWKGSHIDVAIKEWGYPTKEKTIFGRKIYIWDLEGKPNISPIWTRLDVPFLEEKYCNCILEVNDKNIITDAQLDGDYCP
jgi:hypothetical protein